MRRTAPLLLTLLLPVAAAADVEVKALEGGARYEVTFKHQPVIAASKVCVAGDWNGWNKDATPLADPDGDGTYEAKVTLTRGVHHYKFVLNGEVWQHDADNPKTESDGHSGFNSVLDLGGSAPAGAGQRGDGAIAMDQLVHDPQDLADACAVDGRRRLILRLHVLRGDVERVSVLASPRPASGAEMRRIATVSGRDVWEARLWWPSAPQKLRYSFELQDGKSKQRFPVDKKQRFSLSMAKAGRFVTPEWVRDAVFYQIFPDRFRDGDPNNQPQLPRRPEGQPWHVDDRYFEAWGTEPSHFNFMGGDLAGVTQQADYIRSLGANALYLNPIFKAKSNHRYDAADYETVDPALGTKQDLGRLRDALKQRGMKMILDCVFNHTGDAHYAFQDAMQKGERSKYWRWYFFDGGFPVKQSPKPNYRCWWGFGSLPQLNTKNPEVVDHLLKVSIDWLKEGSSGWRLDVPNEVDAVNPEFWPEFRRRVKKQDPEAYIVGEIWTDARAWLQGDKFDAVMNYPVRSAALEFLVKGGIAAPAFEAKLVEQLATYPEAALRVQFNLLGSHDTARVLNVANGDARRVRLAMTFLFAWLGPPVVYYGDEVGVDGGKDPECRRCFPWEEAKQDRTTLEHVRKLGKARAEERALRRGAVRFLLSSGKTSAFVREPEAGEAGRPVICALNAGEGEVELRIPLAGLAGEPAALLGGKVKRDGDALVVTLGPLSGELIALEKQQQ
ncbi:MAG: alpha amylase N-terminal ig-like domain-containing protein [Planctomycetota bacterium]